jgi:hypothetical protein
MSSKKRDTVIRHFLNAFYTVARGYEHNDFGSNKIVNNFELLFVRNPGPIFAGWWSFVLKECELRGIEFDHQHVDAELFDIVVGQATRALVVPDKASKGDKDRLQTVATFLSFEMRDRTLEICGQCEECRTWLETQVPTEFARCVLVHGLALTRHHSKHRSKIAPLWLPHLNELHSLWVRVLDPSATVRLVELVARMLDNDYSAASLSKFMEAVKKWERMHPQRNDRLPSIDEFDAIKDDVHRMSL